MCLLHCSNAHGSLISTSIDFRDRRGFSSISFVSYIVMCLLIAHGSRISTSIDFRDPRLFRFYSICKPHSYVPVSLLMALASPHPLISETQGRSFPYRVGLLLSLRYSVFLYLVDLRYQDKRGPYQRSVV